MTAPNMTDGPTWEEHTWEQPLIAEHGGPTIESTDAAFQRPAVGEFEGSAQPPVPGLPDQKLAPRLRVITDEGRFQEVSTDASTDVGSIRGDSSLSLQPDATGPEGQAAASTPEKPKPYYTSVDDLEAGLRNDEVELHKLGPGDVAPEVIPDLIATIKRNNGEWAGLLLGDYTVDYLTNVRKKQLEQSAPDDLSQEILGMQEPDDDTPSSPGRGPHLHGVRAAAQLAVTNAALKVMDVAEKVGAASARREEVARLNGTQPRRLNRLGWTILAGAGVATAAIVADRLGVGPFSGNSAQHVQTAVDTVHGGGVGHAAANSAVHNLPSGSSTAHQVVHAPGMRHPDDNLNPSHAPSSHGDVQGNPNNHQHPGVNPNLPQHAGDIGVTPQPPTVPLESLTHSGDTMSNHVLNQLHHLGYHVGNGQGGISQANLNHLVANTLTDNNTSFEQARHMQVGSTFHLLPEATIRQMVEEFGKSKAGA